MYLELSRSNHPKETNEQIWSGTEMKKNQRILFQVQGTYVYLIVAVLLGTISGVFLITQAYYLSRIINGVFLDAQTLPQVWRFLLIILALILGRGLLAWIIRVLTNHLAGRIKLTLRGRLLQRLFALGPAFVRGERSGELIATTIEGVEALDPYVSQYFPQAFLAVVVPAIILITVLFTDLPSGIVLLILAPLLPLLLWLAGTMAGVESKRRWQALRLMSAHFLDILQGLTTLKLYGRSQAEEVKVRMVSERFRRTTMKTLRLAFFSSFILEEAATVSTAVIAVEIGLRMLIGEISFQPALFILLITPEFFQPMRQLGAKYHAGMEGSVATERINEILSAPRLGIVDTKEHVLPVQPLALADGSIRFDKVSYSYDGQRPALHGISFEIPVGQKIAFVGPSGAGKSTIAHLLLRFIQADGGIISVNRTSLEMLSSQEWRKQIAWVPQHPYLLHASAADNIRLGNPHASMQEVIEAAKLAHAHEFISALPDQYETMIGERGSRLSGGEGQRISLARAFLKDAPLLILDEATSFLDPAIEAQVLESIAKLMQGRTVLILAHRLSTVAEADRIIVLKKGRIVEEGKHRVLVQRSGLYRQLINVNGKGTL
jgi:ATP-binding cassette subfamily C protein CydD